VHTENKFDLTHRSSFKVDPASLALQMEIPLASYRGRSGTDFPITLRYSSKAWKAVYGGFVDYGGTFYYQSNALYGDDSEAGWSGTLAKYPAPYITWNWGEYFNDGDVYDTAVPPIPCCGSCSKGYWYVANQLETFIWNAPVWVPGIQVHLPNGTTYQMRPESDWTMEQPVFTGTYISVDGSQTKYDATNNIFYLPDGSRYHDLARDYDPVPNHVNRYRDRNGNLFSLTAEDTWTDALGRTYSSSKVTVGRGYDKTLDLPGMGTRLYYTLRYRPLYEPDTGVSILTIPASPGDPRNGLQEIYAVDGVRQIVGENSGEHYWRRDDLPPEGYVRLFNPIVLHEIVLPNGKSYTFTYNNWGEIDKVVYPSGGYERFRYEMVTALGLMPPPNDQFNRGVVERWISAKGDGTDEVHWTYSTSTYSPDTWHTYVTRTETAPDGTRKERVFQGEESEDLVFGYKDPRAGMLLEERVYSSGGQILSRALNRWIITESDDFWVLPSRDPRLDRSVEILFDHETQSAKFKAVRYFYDSDLNPSQVSYFEYRSLTESQGTSAGIDDPALVDGDLLKYDTTIYRVNEPGGQAYRDRHMISLPSYLRTWDAQDVLQAQSEFRYDEYSVFSYGSTSNWEDPGAIRGNVTTTLQRIDASGAIIETHAHYDQFGNQIQRQDGREKLWETEFSVDYAYAYPTLQRTPVPDPTGQQGSDSELETSVGYDFGTGLVLWTQDANSKTTSYTYADSLYRLTQVDYPDNGLVQLFYNDTAGQVTRTTHTRLDDYRYIIKQQSLDGLGRAKSSVLTEEASSIHQDTEYDALGRVWRVSNPYRPGETIYWTETHYDALGRITEVIQPDGALTTTDYASNRTTVIDPAGKMRMSVHDALGRLVEVIEDPLVSGFETFYGYDVLGNLTAVSQGVQTRAFTYDGLSRLLSASNPESGQTTYQYDGNGNLILRVDARGTSTSYAYDGINRILTRSYVEGTDTALTPNVAYTYDGVGTGGANSLGRLSKVDNGVSVTVLQAYDAMGRVLTSRQQFGVSAPGFQYTYDFAGNLKSLAYPSGRQIVNEYDLAGRLSGVKKGPAYYDDYYAGGWASGDRIKYSAHGEISTKRLGNGLWEHINYDPWRLQPTESGLGTNGSDSSVLKLTYHYWGENYGKLVTENNGNMLGQDISVGTTNMYQQFEYDGVNRLIEAKEADSPAPSGNAYWTQTYSYDQYGNRSVAGDFAPQLPGFEASTNRFVAPADYDDAGNLQDGVAQYDAENRLASFGATTYEYDGDGHRVRKTVAGTPDVVTWHVYDGFGRLAAEYGGDSVSAASTKYLTADHLGSTRVITDQSQTAKIRRDYLPFGEEIGSTLALRGIIPGYGLVELNTQKFTGKERDNESGLDFFGARYYSGPHGRFTSPDEFNGGPVELFTEMASTNPTFYADLTNPQSFNKYAYCYNNPLRYTDPDGHATDPRDSLSFWMQSPVIYWNAAKQFARDAAVGYGKAWWYGPEAKNLTQNERVALETVQIGLAVLPSLGGRVSRGGIGPVLKGKAGVSMSVQEIEASGGTVRGLEISFELPSGRTTRADIGASLAGKEILVESKNGPTAELRAAQKEAQATVESGGVLIPKGPKAERAGYTPGKPIKFDEYRVDRHP